MKINGNTVRPGNILEFEGKLWVVQKTQHTQPGKGGAFMQVEMKTIIGSTKTNVRFRSDEKVERVFMDQLPYQYLYPEGEDLIFMDPVNYEQISLSKEFLGDAVNYLKEGMIIDVSSYEGKPITISLPETVTLEIKEADPVVKGQTASSSFKPAVLENDLKILVPPHIEAGMRVVVNTSDGSYVERAKD